MIKTAPTSKTIAIAFVFDETLAPDNARAFFEQIGVEMDEFWGRVHRWVDAGLGRPQSH